MVCQKSRILTKGVEYYPDGTLLLIRCPKCGRENYALSVADSICCWCGFDGHTLLNKEKNGNKNN
jgi:ribosomal protein L37E